MCCCLRRASHRTGRSSTTQLHPAAGEERGSLPVILTVEVETGREGRHCVITIIVVIIIIIIIGFGCVCSCFVFVILSHVAQADFKLLLSRTGLACLILCGQT